VALGAEASFVARTHDMDRQHMIETSGRPRPQGRGLRRDLPELQRVQRRGVVIDDGGHARVVDVAEVGEDRLVVHDEASPDAALAFMLAQISQGPHEPTPIGVFRAVQRAEYVEATDAQLAGAQQQRGPGDLEALLRSGATWEVT
jgi:2-oxoglutarate/2-oxoacid ferredoxin oxidoreductase subunit beta